MKLYRLPLLALLGAISANIGWMIYIIILFCRYSVPIPVLSGEMWGLFFSMPAIAGVFTGLFFPLWQRMVSIPSRPLRSIYLWVVLGIILISIQFLFLGPNDVIIGVFSMDFVIWMLCSVVAGICFHLLRIMTGETVEAEAAVVGKLRHTLGFIPKATQSIRGVAMVFDLQGFAAFFNQPWAKAYVPEYLNLVLTAVSTELLGGKRFWGDGRRIPSLLHPVHQKFLGDGMLYVWAPPAGRNSFSDDFLSEIVARVSRVRDELPLINLACIGPIPESFDLPERIRFGIARGQIYELTRKHSNAKEYMGFCINLASRLQGYCPELSLIASTRLKVPEEALEESGLLKVVATRIKGFSEEEVLVIEDEFNRLSDERREQLFQA